MNDPRPYSDLAVKPEGGDLSQGATAGYVSEGPTLTPCNCTGRCRDLGYCPCNPPALPGYRPCGHYFPWYGVVPPMYCPICGAYIGPIYVAPQPPQPYIVYSTGTGGTSAPPRPQGETISSD